MPPNPRVVKAFRAMRDLGISEDKVKPVLKSLLKAYEKNWELIEEENYRVLADAIFENEEAEAAQSKTELETTEQERMVEEEAQGHERPLKRLRLKYQGQASDSCNNSNQVAGTSLIKPKDEPVELPEVYPTNKLRGMVGTTPPNNENWRIESQHVSGQSLDRSKGKQPVSPKYLAIQQISDTSQPADKSQPNIPKIIESVAVSHPTSLRNREEEVLSPHFASGEKRLESGRSSQAVPKQNTVGGQILVQPKEEPFTGDIPECDLPLAVIYAETSNEGDSSRRNSLIREQDGFEPLTLESLGGKDTSDDVPACSNETRTNSQLATIPGSESYSESEETIQVSPRIDLLRKFSSGDPLIGRGMRFDIPNGVCNVQSDSEVLQLPPPCNGIDDSSEPDKEASHCNGGVHQDKEQNNVDDANCKSLVVVQQHQLTPDQIRSLHDVFDISKGQERVAISLVNEINSESPPSFHYIPQNVVFQNAYMNFSLARIGDGNCCSTCFGDCLSLSTPCACAHETCGEFAYTADGLVKEEFLDECVSMNRDPQKHCQFFCKECPLERSKNEDVIEPCKGHLVRKFIKECWWKCGCNKQCGNRVVQRGITRSLQVFMTEKKGWGLRTLEDLPKGAFVCEYVGEVLTNAELFDRVSQSPKGEVHSYPVLLDADWSCEGVLKDEEALCLDATHYGNVARFINHKCFDSNMVEIPVEVETPDHHYYHLAFFTTRNVKAMEELTWDYGIDFDDVDHPVKAFRCQCGSRFCRNIRRPSRSRSSSRR